MLLGPNTVAGALGVPVMTIGVKRWVGAVGLLGGCLRGASAGSVLMLGGC